MVYNAEVPPPSKSYELAWFSGVQPCQKEKEKKVKHSNPGVVERSCTGIQALCVLPRTKCPPLRERFPIHKAS